MELFLKGYVDLAAHDEDLTPELRQTKERHAKQLIERIAQQAAAAAQRKSAAKAERPRRQSPIKRELVALMLRERADGATWPEFLEGWLRDGRGDYYLSSVAKGYRVTSAATGKVVATYAPGTLMKFWSEAAKK
ncbi:MAG TPA: hypothetical protein VJ738_01840 [Steroidobacteraceae bacterium]|nr:hypothetical protein [Steroidobacteraceae bacterium]